MLTFILVATAALAVGFALDLILGDPQGWPHLIRFFGKLIAWLERRLYSIKNKRIAGGGLVLCVLLVCGGVPLLLLALSWRISPFLYLVLESLLCWQLLATRSLRDESLPVYQELQKGNLPKAREALSMIVGRDTARLDAPGITKAAVETVAENTADGVAAPLFFMAFGTSVLGCVYKAVNTMDSMIGYRNERYQDFGRCAARLDDVLNFVPARLCAILMIVAAKICKFDARNAYRIWRRDNRKHASPNSAQTEAVMAGALGIQLAGDAWYQGKLLQKPYIGNDRNPIQREDILRAHRMLITTSWLLFFLSLIIRGLFYATL